MEKAEDSFDLAKTQHELADKQHESAHKQHESADRQHESADKLDTLGHALEAEAVELKGEMEMDAGRTSPRLVERPDGVPPEAGSIPAASPK